MLVTRPIALLSAGATVLAVALPVVATSVAAAPLVRPATAPAATDSAYAVVGTMLAPGSGVRVQDLAAASDGTVYAVLQGGIQRILVIPPGQTTGVTDDSFAAADPSALAVTRDDTLLVLLDWDQKVAFYAPGTTTPATLISIPDVYNFPRAIAVGVDDTVAVATYDTSPGASVYLFGTSSTSIQNTIAAPFASNNLSKQIGAIAIDGSGRTLVANDFVGIQRYSPSGVLDDTLPALFSTSLVAFPDDTIYSANRNTYQVDVIAPGDMTVTYSVPVAPRPIKLVRTLGGDIISLNDNDESFSRIRPGARTSELILTGITGANAAVIGPHGMLYIGQSINGSPSVAVASEVSASLAQTSGAASSSIAADITGLPAGVEIDDSTVEAVWWGDDSMPFTRSGNQISVVAPSGSGSVPVVLQLQGGNAVIAGTFTYVAATPPSPVPATAPRDVIAIAGNATAQVSWLAPASTGSFPVSTYQVISSPGGGTCLTSALTCQISGLANGTAYTFTVKALTGAGWSAASEASNAVVPRAGSASTVVISGSREGSRIKVTGTSTGFGMGGELNPWMRMPGQAGFTKGTAQILVSADGTFEWSRRSGKTISVYVATPDLTVRSNTVTITAR